MRIGLCRAGRAPGASSPLKGMRIKTALRAVRQAPGPVARSRADPGRRSRVGGRATAARPLPEPWPGAACGGGLAHWRTCRLDRALLGGRQAQAPLGAVGQGAGRGVRQLLMASVRLAGSSPESTDRGQGGPAQTAAAVEVGRGGSCAHHSGYVLLARFGPTRRALSRPALQASGGPRSGFPDAAGDPRDGQVRSVRLQRARRAGRAHRAGCQRWPGAGVAPPCVAIACYPAAASARLAAMRCSDTLTGRHRAVDRAVSPGQRQRPARHGSASTGQRRHTAIAAWRSAGRVRSTAPAAGGWRSAPPGQDGRAAAGWPARRPAPRPGSARRWPAGGWPGPRCPGPGRPIAAIPALVRPGSASSSARARGRGPGGPGTAQD